MCRAKAKLRTMVGDLADPSGLPEDLANLGCHSVRFSIRHSTPTVRSTPDHPLTAAPDHGP